MDHGHAHPSHNLSSVNLASNDLNRQQTPRRPLSFLNVSHSSSPLRRSPQTPLDTPLTLPQRRLQLRNAGFRAPRLPSHRFSTRISRWFSEKDDNHTQRHRTLPCNRENSPPTIRRRNTKGSPIPGTILQEITNSTRGRHSGKSTFVPIYEDDQDSSPTHSWYHDAPSTQKSPIASDTVHENRNEMKPREISGNAQRSPPPLSSPLARQTRGRSKRSLNLRKTSFPASEHIVFLETKLEEVEKSQYSPKTGLPLKDKIKALTTENNRLQEMFTELEHQFETRLRESVEHKTGVEVSLRRKIKHLEEEIVSKDCTIRELEYRNDASLRDLSNAETYKAAVERLEYEKRGLEESNRGLEKRNDVLTELLGHSPARSHHGFELPSSVRDCNKRTPRPRSMMPRIPSSPTHITPRRPLSLHGAPSPFQHDYFSPFTALQREHDHPCNDGENVDPQKFCDDSQSVDSGLGESCSIRSGNEPISKRSSMHSYSSASPAAWGLPLPPSPTEDSNERSGRKRKTRRFASGSTQLKPLVLPALNAASGMPQSAPLPNIYSSSGYRDISEQSIDPTTSFLSRSYDTPTQPRRRSSTWAAEDALQALEGIAEVRYLSFEEALADPGPPQSMPDPPLTYPDLPNHFNYSHAFNHFSPSLIDEVIMEEDSRAFLSNQVEDVGDQSFSSMVGELSITESDIDRAGAEAQSQTRQFPQSELPRPLSIELSSSFRPGQPLEDLMEEYPPQTNQTDECALQEYTCDATTQGEAGLTNPLVSPYLLSDATFQPTKASYAGISQMQNLSQQEPLPGRGSLLVDPGESSVQRHRHSTGIGIQAAKMMMPNPLKAVPSRKRPPRAHSPLEVLQRKGSPTVSLTSVTTRTIFGTISRYTSYMREIRRDPTALARRVIANAWCSNWKRFGKLSWWVLGLFLGPRWKQQAEAGQGWEAYDGENIAQAEHERLNGPGPSCIQETPHSRVSNLLTPRLSTRPQQRRVESRNPSRTRPSPRDDGKDSEKTIKTCWGKSLYLWGKFSVAIMLAVGGAVIKGPEEMLKDCDLHIDTASATRLDHMRSGRNPSEVDQDPIYDYSLDLREDDIEEARAPHSFRTAKSAVRSEHTNRKPPDVCLLSATSQFTFAAPSMNDYDCYDDNGQSRPSRGRVRVTASEPQPSDGESRIIDIDEESHDLGTLQWMQNLSVKDFEPYRDIDDQDRTIRASPRKVGKRTFSTLS
jgi:hypothetical protein